MQHFVLVLLFSLFQGYTSSSKVNYNHNFRNLGYKIIIFKKKECPKTIEYIKDKCQIYYEKLIVSISESMIEYEKLSNDEKEVLDLIISIIFN